MTEQGIGDMQWVNDWVGIPYLPGGRSRAGIDCYGIVAGVYLEVLGIALPDWVTDFEVDWDGDSGILRDIEQPVDFCFIHNARSGITPDHWGVVLAGGVLSANRMGSTFVPLKKYLELNPGGRICAFDTRGGSH